MCWVWRLILAILRLDCRLRPSLKPKSRDKPFTYTDAISVLLKTRWCTHYVWEWKVKQTKEQCAIESNHINIFNLGSKIRVIITTLHYLPQIKITSWVRYVPEPESKSPGGQASMNNMARSHLTKQNKLTSCYNTQYKSINIIITDSLLNMNYKFKFLNIKLKNYYLARENSWNYT